LFTVDHVHLNNDPILIPGNETVDLDVHILRPISGDYTVKIRVQRHLLFGFMEVPCNTQNNIGSWYNELYLFRLVFELKENISFLENTN